MGPTCSYIFGWRITALDPRHQFQFLNPDEPRNKTKRTVHGVSNLSFVFIIIIIIIIVFSVIFFCIHDKSGTKFIPVENILDVYNLRGCLVIFFFFLMKHA